MTAAEKYGLGTPENVDLPQTGRRRLMLDLRLSILCSLALSHLSACTGDTTPATYADARGDDARVGGADTYQSPDAGFDADAAIVDRSPGLDADDAVDLGVTDSGVADDAAVVRDADPTDVDLGDAELADAELADAEVADGALTDAALADAGRGDAGWQDAGSVDATALDATALDATALDATALDASPPGSGSSYDDAGVAIHIAATCLSSTPFVRVASPLPHLCTQTSTTCGGGDVHRRVWVEHTKSSTATGWHVHILFDGREYPIPYPAPHELLADAVSLFSFTSSGAHQFVRLDGIAPGAAQVEACAEGGATFAGYYEGLAGELTRSNVDAFIASEAPLGTNVDRFTYTSTTGVSRLLWELQ